MRSEIVQAQFEKGRARWPSLPLAYEDFRSHLESLGVDEARLQQNGEDLFVVVAVLNDLPGALVVLDNAFLQQARTVVARIDRSPSFAADVLQELRIKLLTGPNPKLRTYTGSGGLVDWLRVAALRTAINLVRSDRLLPTGGPPVEAMLVDPDGTQMKQWYVKDFQEAIERAFQQLPLRDRNLLRLHFVDGLTIDRIGVIFGAHRATVARWLVAIRKRLFDEAKASLALRHGMNSADVKSLYRLLESHVHITISRILLDRGPAVEESGA